MVLIGAKINANKQQISVIIIRNIIKLLREFEDLSVTFEEVIFVLKHDTYEKK